MKGFSSCSEGVTEKCSFYDIWYKTHGVRGKVTKSERKEKKGGVKAVIISTRQQEVQGWPHSIGADPSKWENHKRIPTRARPQSESNHAMSRLPRCCDRPEQKMQMITAGDRSGRTSTAEMSARWGRRRTTPRRGALLSLNPLSSLGSGQDQRRERFETLKRIGRKHRQARSDLLPVSPRTAGRYRTHSKGGAA